MTNKTIVITGASSGIGEATTHYLDSLGFRVFAGVRHDGDVKKLTETASSRVTPLLLDVTNEASMEEAAAIVGQEVGEAGIKGLVNNAGIFVGGPLEFLAIDALRNQFEVNVIGQISVTQKFLPLLRSGQGRIVFIGSTSGFVSPPFFGPYSASKYALRALTDSLRNELYPFSICVSLVVAGSVTTPIWNKAFLSANEMFNSLPTAAQEFYGNIFKRTIARGNIRSKVGIPPVAVAKVIHHAITSRYARPQYLVGIDAKLQALLFWLFPSLLIDILTRRQLKIKKLSTPAKL